MHVPCRSPHSAFLVMTLLLTAVPALADEVWQSDFGRVIWEVDRGDTAVFLLDDEGNNRTVRLFVEGLVPHMLGGRGYYEGVWIASQKDGSVTPGCSVAMVDPLGGPSTEWGTFQLTFVSEAFPSDFAGSFGDCLAPRTIPFSAVAITG